MDEPLSSASAGPGSGSEVLLGLALVFAIAVQLLMELFDN